MKSEPQAVKESIARVVWILQAYSILFSFKRLVSK